jgi:uncharacterized protein (UPF0332 family)
MSAKQQISIQQWAYAEVLRYMDNAKETIKKANKEDDFYNDPKYVRMACGTAYNGVLIALDAYLLQHGVEQKKGRKSIEYYTFHISKWDKKLLKYVNLAYEILHLAGYYDGVKSVAIIRNGFELAYDIINYIKPENPISYDEIRKPSLAKRVYSFFF